MKHSVEQLGRLGYGVALSLPLVVLPEVSLADGFGRLVRRQVWASWGVALSPPLDSFARLLRAAFPAGLGTWMASLGIMGRG